MPSASEKGVRALFQTAHVKRALTPFLVLAFVVLSGCAEQPPAPAPTQSHRATGARSTAKPAPRPATPIARPATPAAKPPAASKPATTTAKPAPKTAPPAVATAKPATPAPAPSPPPPPAPVLRTPQDRYANALTLLKSSQYAEAETALATSIKDYPQQSGPLTNLGILHARTNRKPEALAEFKKAVALNPANAVAQNWAGVLSRENGDLAGAEQAYKAAIAADPKYLPAQLNLAILYDQYLKKPRDALDAYKRYQQQVGKPELRTQVWIAELQSKLPPEPKPAPVAAKVAGPATPAAKPAAAPAKPAAPAAKPAAQPDKKTGATKS
jgi:hypothetical protein